MSSLLACRQTGNPITETGAAQSPPSWSGIDVGKDLERYYTRVRHQVVFDIREIEASSVPSPDVADHLAAVTVAALGLIPARDPAAAKTVIASLGAGRPQIPGEFRGTGTEFAQVLRGFTEVTLASEEIIGLGVDSCQETRVDEGECPAVEVRNGHVEGCSDPCRHGAG